MTTIGTVNSNYNSNFQIKSAPPKQDMNDTITAAATQQLGQLRQGAKDDCCCCCAIIVGVGDCIIDDCCKPICDVFCDILCCKPCCTPSPANPQNVPGNYHQNPPPSTKTHIKPIVHQKQQNNAATAKPPTVAPASTTTIPTTAAIVVTITAPLNLELENDDSDSRNAPPPNNNAAVSDGI